MDSESESEGGGLAELRARAGPAETVFLAGSGEGRHGAKLDEAGVALSLALLVRDSIAGGGSGLSTGEAGLVEECRRLIVDFVACLFLFEVAELPCRRNSLRPRSGRR